VEHLQRELLFWWLCKEQAGYDERFG
jgi:hypothetical protein